MRKKIISVLDFGSSKVSIYCGHRVVNDNIKILASGEAEYEGFINGEFLEPNSISSSIMDAIRIAESQLHAKIDTLYVGVPAEFCYVTTKTESTYFPKLTKITKKVLDNVFLGVKDDDFKDTHTIINKSPIHFELDEGYTTLDVLGLYTNKFDTLMSVVLVENQFIHLVSSILRSIGIVHFDFICDVVAESNYLLEESERVGGAVLVDVGFITTSVSYVKGDGVVDMKSFSLGGGYITEDIARILEVDYNVAEAFKRKAVITLRPNNKDEKYKVEYGGEEYLESIVTINEIIKDKLDKICNMIRRCLDTFEELPSNYKIYFTGGGLNYIDGVKDYLAREFAYSTIEKVAPKSMILAKPDLSSVVSLLNTAIKIER